MVKKKFVQTVLVLILSLKSFTALAFIIHENEKTPATQLLQFRIAQYSLFQESGIFNTTFSAAATWAPEYFIDDRFSLVTPLSFVPLLNGATQSLFLSINYALFVSFHAFKYFRFEAGPGYQVWFSPTTVSSFSAGSNAHLIFQNKLLGFIESLFCGYSYLFQYPAAHEVRIGTQLSF
jgi:hypothetical protein